MTLLIPLAFLAALFASVHWTLAVHVALLPLAAAALSLALARRASQGVVAVALLAAAVGVLRPSIGLRQESLLSRLVSEREVTALRGEVVDEPSPRDRAQFVRLRVNAVRFAEGEWQVVDGMAQVVARVVPALHHGDFVEARGRVQPPEASATAGYAAYLRRQGIEAVAAFPFLEQRGERVAGANAPSEWLSDSIVWLRSASVASLERLLPEPHAALAQGILLGRRATMPAELTEAMRVTGLSHLSAVSGYNVSLVIGVAAAAVGLTPSRRGWRRPAGVGVASVFLWLFVVLVGASGSVLRAAAMAQLALAGIAFGRRGTAGGMLLWGSALLAAWRPAVVTDLGWQLSFLGTAGLAWLGGPIERGLGRVTGWARGLEWVMGPLRSGLAATLAAQVFVFPVLVTTFGSLSLVAPLSNVLALPLIPWIMAASFLASVCGIWVAPAAPLFAALAWIPLTLLLALVEWTAGMPWASASLPPLAPVGVAGYLALLVALCVREERRARSVSPDEERERGLTQPAHAGSVLGGAPYAAPAPLHRRITVALAVSVTALLLIGAAMGRPAGGYGDAAGALVLELPAVRDGTLLYAQPPEGGRLLVDGGPTAGGATALLGRYLRPWDRTVDAIVLSDPRESHVMGVGRVLERYRVGVVADAVEEYSSAAYRQTREAVRRGGVRHVRLEEGSPFALGEHLGALSVTPLRSAARPDPADRVEGLTFPVPLQVRWGTFTALLPGDATPAQLRALLAGEHDLRATVLVLPERLLRYPETARLLAAADPELVLTQGELSDGPPLDTELPTAWHRTSADGDARLRVYPDGTYVLGR